MKDLYRIRFNICAKPNASLNLDDVLISSIKKWMESKFGVATVASVIPDWAAFHAGASHGNADNVGEFCAETVSARDSWACKIIEFPRYSHKYIPRKWITEIGVIFLSVQEWDVSYSVRYDDLAGYSGVTQSRPKTNIPNIAKQLLSSENWVCTSNGETIDAELSRYKAYNGALFGIDDCRKITDQHMDNGQAQIEPRNKGDEAHMAPDLTKLNKSGIEYLCRQMSPKEIKSYFQKFPKDFTRIKPGFRPNALTDDDAINLMIRYSDKPFIWSFIENTIKIWFSEINDFRKEQEKNGATAEESLLMAIPQSVFADNIELYVTLSGESYTTEYVLLLKSAATMLRKAVLVTAPAQHSTDPAIAEEITVLTKKIEQLESDLEAEKAAHTITAETLAEATENNTLLQQSLSAAEARLDSAATRTVQMQEELELLRKLAKYADSDDTDASDPEYEYTSVCQVYSDHYSGQTWLTRLADIEDGKLSRFTRLEDVPYYFGNRDRLFWRDGPREDGYIGIWRWNAVPNKSDPSTDYVTTSFSKYGKIIEIIELPDCRTYEDIIKYLSEKSIPYTPGRKCFFALSGSKGNIPGLLCNDNDFDITNTSAKLKDSTTVLPQFVISSADIITIAGKRFYRATNMGTPQDIYHLKSPFAVVKDVIVSRATSAALRQQGITKKEAQHCQVFLMELPVTTIVQEIADAYGCPEAEATEYLTRFLEFAENYLNESDLDLGTLAAALSRNPDMVAKCKQILEAEWRAENDAMLNEAQKKRDRVAQEALTLETRAGEIEASIAGLLTRQADIEAQIDAKIQLATDVETRVAARIAAARVNAADFICEMAFASGHSIPMQSKVTEVKRSGVMRRNIMCNQGGTIDDLDMFEEELACNFNALGYNAVSANEMAQIITFCICNRQPVVCGNNAAAIADAVSALLYSKGAYEITLPLASDRLNELCGLLETECAEEKAVILFNGVFDGYSMNAYSTVMQYVSQWTNNCLVIFSASGIDPASIPSAVWENVWYIDGDAGLSQFPHGTLNGFDISCDLTLELGEGSLKAERKKLKQFTSILSNRAVLNYAGYMLASGNELKKSDILILQLIIHARAQNKMDDMLSLLKSVGVDVETRKLLDRYL